MATQHSSRLAAPSLYLIPVAGPEILPLQLIAPGNRAVTLTLGRHESCDLPVPPNAESVSRYHARFRFDPDSSQWRIADLGSRWGTYVNGVKLTPQMETPIVNGDLLRIEPWRFTVSAELQTRGLTLTDDMAHAVVNTRSSAQQVIREDLLELLLEAAVSIHDAATEPELVGRLLDSAVRGSGLPNAAVLRPIDANGQFEVLGTRTSALLDSARFTFSRSLLNAAAQGQTAELSQVADMGQSIAQMNIAAAICVPLTIGGAAVAFLYMDCRTRPGTPGGVITRPNAGAFCTALGRLAGLALANLRRMEMERRQAAIEHDLRAATVAQRWVLPPRETTIGPIRVTGESRPGRYVGGDFFDVIDLGAGRVAVALGDVSGKGFDASVLMTAAQGFLHASLMHHRSAAEAMMAVNRFIAPRRPENRFITLWLAVIDTAAKTLSYIDAGHGYAMLFDHDGNARSLNDGGGPPLGVARDFAYVAETVPLPAQGRLIVVSDGFVEQPASSGGHGRQFQMTGVQDCITASATDEISELFTRLIKHAGTDHLADDATAVCARWETLSGQVNQK